MGRGCRQRHRAPGRSALRRNRPRTRGSCRGTPAPASARACRRSRRSRCPRSRSPSGNAPGSRRRASRPAQSRARPGPRAPGTRSARPARRSGGRATPRRRIRPPSRRERTQPASRSSPARPRWSRRSRARPGRSRCTRSRPAPRARATGDMPRRPLARASCVRRFLPLPSGRERLRRLRARGRGVSRAPRCR